MCTLNSRDGLQWWYSEWEGLTECSRWRPGWAQVFQGLLQDPLPVELYYLYLLTSPLPPTSLKGVCFSAPLILGLDIWIALDLCWEKYTCPPLPSCISIMVVRRICPVYPARPQRINDTWSRAVSPGCTFSPCSSKQSCSSQPTDV